MKNLYYLLILTFLLISCSENEEAEPDSVKKYLESNIFKEIGSYSRSTNNTVLELTSTSFIDFKINSNQFNVHYSFHDLLDPDFANCYMDKSINGDYTIQSDNDSTFIVDFNSPNIMIFSDSETHIYTYDSSGNINLEIYGFTECCTSYINETLEVSDQQEFDSFKLRAPNEC
tara:strand:- start:140 stop:658 length:519 start_codon:yes stop_codon:yes gene_type:complete